MGMQDADAAAAAAMRATEGAVKSEMEAKAVYEQVKLAVSAAQASREFLMDEEEAEAAEAEAAAAEVESKSREKDKKGKVCSCSSVAKAGTRRCRGLRRAWTEGGGDSECGRGGDGGSCQV